MNLMRLDEALSSEDNAEVIKICTDCIWTQKVEFSYISRNRYVDSVYFFYLNKTRL